MGRSNLEKAEGSVRAFDTAMPCPSCGEKHGVDVDSVDVELGDGDSVGAVRVYGNASCRNCFASWRFEGRYHAAEFHFDVDDWGDGRDGSDKALDLMALNDVVRGDLGVSSRPRGAAYVAYVAAMADAVRRSGIAEVDDETIEVLETENADSLVEAVMVAMGRTSIEAVEARERELCERAGAPW